jgi:glycosyltransferase involved in cell wall biosynthesis
MPIYNGSEYLSESIGSILEQDFGNFILLCYDDGSTDDSIEVIKSFGDKRIRIIEGGENRGGVYARTQLINAVDTKYCMWLDDDDRYCRSDAVSEAMRTIKSNCYDMVSFIRIDEVDKNGNHAIKEPCLYGDFSYCGDKLFEKFYPVDNHFIFNSKIFKTELLKKSIPDDDILSRRFCTDDMFFAAMWFFHARRYYNNAVSDPIVEYKKDVGIWGSALLDKSAKRIGDLCVLQYCVFLSLYNRMVGVRPLNGIELNNLVAGTNFPMIAKLIRNARSIYGDAYADSLMNIWHSAFGADGVHLLNGIDMFEMPVYIKKLEDMMR